MADVLYLGLSVGRVDEAACEDGDAGDMTRGLPKAEDLLMGLRLVVSSRVAVGVGDLAPRLIGGGVAPSELPDSLSEAVDCKAGSTDPCGSRKVAEVPGLEEVTFSGDGVADALAGAGESLSSPLSGEEVLEAIGGDD